jgi:hypothetical protein
MKLKFLEDGCKWCGSQEWDEGLTDVDHAEDCPAPFLMLLAAGEYVDWDRVSEIAARITGSDK